MDADLPQPSSSPASPSSSPAGEVTLDIAGDGDLLAEFISEAREHLAEIEQGVLTLEKNPHEDTALAGIFRAFHSFKGVAGYLNLAPIHDLAHELESVLDMVRHEKLAMDARVIQLILESKDLLEHFVAEIETRLKNPDAASSASPIRVPTAELERRAREILVPQPAQSEQESAPAPEPARSGPESASETTATEQTRPLTPLFAPKATVEKAAQTPSPVSDQEAPSPADAPASPSTVAAMPASGTPAVTLPLAADSYEAAIAAPSIRISPTSVPDRPRLTLPLNPLLPTPSANPNPEPVADAGTSESASGPVSVAPYPGMFAAAPFSLATPPPLPPRSSGTASPTTASPATGGGSGSSSSAAADSDGQSSGTTRVDVARLDTLVEYVRELSVVQSLIGQSIKELGVKNTRLTRQLTQMQRLSRELQRTSMAMRLVPLGGLFRRIQRVVRDLARREGKQINLVLSGDDTELDRTLVEQLADPLTHMVRNAVDHGIESPEERRLIGKSPVGTLRIEARHAGSQVVVRIADDGAGLNRERILLKGIERGLVPPTAVLEREEIDQLIFAPGFTTADVITDISGRGVGLDVVRQHIDSLRGQIDIESETGRGTAFIVTLPLTTSILDGMIVTIGAQRFIIPAPSVLRAFRPTHHERGAGPFDGGSNSRDARSAETDEYGDADASLLSIHTDGTVFEMEGSRIAVIDVRGKLIPLVRVSEVLGIQALFREATDGIVVLVEAEGREVALLVDRVVGKQEVVIKPLGETFRRNDLFAGASLLSDGVLSLVLNILAIARHTSRLHDITERRAQEQRWLTTLEGGEIVI